MLLNLNLKFLIVCKYLSNLAPAWLSEFLHLCGLYHFLRSADHMLQNHNADSEVDGAFSAVAPQLWNDLQIHIIFFTC